MIFENRYDAALKLMTLLAKYKGEEAVLLAIPRGGVSIAYPIAKKYHLPLDLLMTKKIGHPNAEEFAIGYVSLEDHFVDNAYNIPQFYIEDKIKQIRESLEKRYKKFMGLHEPINLENKIVIITDDGIATGHTILAAINLIKRKHPKKIVVAIPVAPRDTAEKISKKVDDFICLHRADDFYAVGQYYHDFSEVSDEEVIDLLNKIKTSESVLQNNK